MPIYEYECKNCHHKFELIQKISDVPATQCPQCFEEAVIRLVSAARFQLKGTGWYATDFKDKNASGSAKNNSIDAKKPNPVTVETNTKGEKD